MSIGDSLVRFVTVCVGDTVTHPSSVSIREPFGEEGADAIDLPVGRAKRLHRTDPKPWKFRKLCKKRSGREHNGILQYAM